MRSVFIILLLALCLTSCASVQATTPLHKMSIKDAPKWNMVSLEGLDDYLLDIYNSGSVKSSIKGGEVFSAEIPDVSVEKFSKNSAVLTIHGKTEFENEDVVHINLASCNAMIGRYNRVGEKLKYRVHSQSMVSCERVVTDRSGTLIALSTPMFVEEYIKGILPQITDYRVSSDNQILTLLGERDEILGVFERDEVAS